MTSPVILAQFSLEFYSTLSIPGAVWHFQQAATSLWGYRVAHSQAQSADGGLGVEQATLLAGGTDIQQPQSSC